LYDNLKSKTEQLEALAADNNKMKELLEELTATREKEITVFRERETELENKVVISA